MKFEVYLLLTVCIVAICTDVRERKIPNWLTAALAVGALLVHFSEGWAALGAAVAVGIVVFAMGTVAHSVRVLGGGDVKLLAAGALTLGFPDCVIFVLYTLLGGGFLAVAFALAQGRLRRTLVNLRTLARTQTRALLDTTAPPARMPYAVAIAFGAATVALADTILPALRFPT